MLFRLMLILGGLLLIFTLLKGLKRSTDSKRPRNFGGVSFDKVRQEKDMGELVKDPISGTYIPKGKAASRTIDGETYYFESEENALEFLEKRQKS